jgi:hypothetical protein
MRKRESARDERDCWAPIFCTNIHQSFGFKSAELFFSSIMLLFLRVSSPETLLASSAASANDSAERESQQHQHRQQRERHVALAFLFARTSGWRKKILDYKRTKTVDGVV